MGNSTEVNRRYYLANKEKVAARNKVNRARNFAYVREIKDRTPCTDCGLNYPHYIMEFDHVSGDKVANVSLLCNDIASVERIQAEIDKCELVCANCHRERTFSRGQQYGN